MSSCIYFLNGISGLVAEVQLVADGEDVVHVGAGRDGTAGVGVEADGVGFAPAVDHPPAGGVHR